MTKPPPAKPASPPKDPKDAREENLARALRDNLRRRKDQARARAGQEPAPEPPVDKKD
jgi:hypothetical protein